MNGGRPIYKVYRVVYIRGSRQVVAGGHQMNDLPLNAAKRIARALKTQGYRGIKVLGRPSRTPPSTRKFARNTKLPKYIRAAFRDVERAGTRARRNPRGQGGEQPIAGYASIRRV